MDNDIHCHSARIGRTSTRTWRWLVFAALMVMFAACTPESDQVAIQRAMDAMETAVESGDTDGFMEHVSKEFSGQAGELDAGQLRTTLIGLKFRHEHIGLALAPADFKLSDDRATVKVQLLATGGSWMPETGQVLDIESHWQRVDGEWKCFAAEWTGRW